jgi:hypothetical protein
VERLPAGYPRTVVACAVGAIALPLLGLIGLRVMAGRLRRDDERSGRDSSAAIPARAAAR